MGLAIRKRVLPLRTEKRPVNPVPRGRPHGTRVEYTVKDNDTFESVAQDYGINVKQLILHNFQTMDPGELNWYLREYVGCDLPTHDRLNWRFSKTANPGKIYIPQQLIVLDPIYVVGGLDQQTVDLTAPGFPEFLASEKFTHEFKIPPKGSANLGNFLAVAKITVSGELKQDGGLVKTTLKKDQIKVAIEKKITEDTKLTFSGKIDTDKAKLQPFVDAVAKGSREDFFSALRKQFEATIKTTYRWDNIVVEPEIGGEFSETPLILRVTGGYEDYLVIEHARFKGKFSVSMGLNVGLSAQAWEWIAQNVGQPVLRFFVEKAGPALVELGEWLVSAEVLTAGAVVVGTVVGTLGLISLCAWIVQDAGRKGELTGLATWYVSAYTSRVFDRPYFRPTGFIVGDTKLRDNLVEMGEKDSLSDARAILRRNNNAAARGTDQEALDAFRMVLLAENQLNEDRARVKLRVALEEKSKQLAGL